MFRTIYEVKKVKGESQSYRAYFNDFGEAYKFAQNEVKNNPDEYVHQKSSHFDGSWCYSWIGYHTEILFDNDAWLTDISGVIEFHDSSGLKWDFESFDDFEEFIERSQKMAYS